MNAIQKAQAMQPNLVSLIHRGYDARMLQDGSIEVQDLVRVMNGGSPVVRIEYETVTLKSQREVWRFIDQRR
jgi:hypothetical protein